MYHSDSHNLAVMGSFRLKNHLMRYSVFVPKLYNLCKSPGFEAGRILPSRAFCSDESQGFPVIMIAKHFGTFPLTRFIPWAAYIQLTDGTHYNLEQEGLYQQLAVQSGYNPDQVDLEAATHSMTEAEEVQLPVEG